MLRIVVIASLSLFIGYPACAQSSKFQTEAGQNQPGAGMPIVFAADLSADEESAVTESPGIGRIECVLEPATQKLSWKLTYSGLTSPVTHAGFYGPQIPGGEAGVLIEINPKSLKSPVEGSVILDDGQLEYLLIGRMYVNVHTVKIPVGEIRGHLGRQRPKPSQ